MFHRRNQSLQCRPPQLWSPVSLDPKGDSKISTSMGRTFQLLRAIQNTRSGYWPICFFTIAGLTLDIYPDERTRNVRRRGLAKTRNTGKKEDLRRERMRWMARKRNGWLEVASSLFLFFFFFPVGDWRLSSSLTSKLRQRRINHR